ncbi:RagB/SusD family nutrient uptake outer membrane protein [Compostibacter hankyongensis]
MKVYRIYVLLALALTVSSAGCKKILEPNNDDHSTFNRVYDDPSFAEGLLITAYTLIPTNDYKYDEVATDDAVTNDKFSDLMKMATGGWSALSNPENVWDNCNKAILYINRFLDVVDTVTWKRTNPQLNELYNRRLKGEAYALRGLFKYYLLRNHAGYDASGALLGFPIYDKFLSSEADFSQPRASFSESVKSAYADLDTSLRFLSADYGNLSDLNELPPGFGTITDIGDYNTVFGDVTQQRISGRHARALKARLALLAASPAFNEGNNVRLWEDAADYTAGLLDDIGGVGGLDPQGAGFYLKQQVDDANLTSGDKKDIGEILWRRPIYNNHQREQDNFPPSLYGNGEINPSQNLVDAFPMANGYPIDAQGSGYDPAKPYDNRDPRLSLYIVYNGSTMKGQTIGTAAGSGDDAIDNLQNGTRTGYYLRKLLREDVNVNPISISDQKHYNTHIRYTELFLNYAEAANEAWGPDGRGSHAYSAKDVIAAIRKRAGIAQPDNYLASIATQEDMRTLIRNERRLELCFEGFRFWDLRRWKADLTVPVKGVRISGGNYQYFTVEQRNYNNSYMHYGPVPDKEIVKFHLTQNKGW